MTRFAKEKSTPAHAKPPSLVTILTRRVTAVTFVAIGLLTAALLFLLHHNIHEQTDALLLRLAEEEALSALHHPDEIHLHDVAIAAPTLQATVVHKFALILNAECDVLEQTTNIDAPVLPAVLCPQEHHPGARVLTFANDLTTVPLRVAAVYERGPDDTLWAFVVGIPHKDVDASTWRSTGVAIPLALLAALLIVFAVWLAIKPAVRELDTLRRALDLLERTDPEGSLTEASRVIEHTAHTSQEVAILARTLQQALEEMRRASAQRARFIAEASHELRTPLTVLRGELELALRKERSAPQYKDALHIALESTLQLQELSEHLLEISRTERQTAHIQTIDLHATVQHLLQANHDRFAQRGVRVQPPHPQKPTFIEADPLLTERAIQNLFDNVLKHADAQTLTIEIQHDHVLVVRDDGRGLDHATQSILFEPFGRSDEGTSHGLGLYLVRSIMRAQGGEVLFVPTTLGAQFELHFQASQI